MSVGKFSKGHGKKPGSTPTRTPPPPSQSGGTSGDLTVKGHKTETPVVKTYVPPPPSKPKSKKIPSKGRKGHLPTKKPGPDPLAAALHALEDTYSAVAHQQPGADIARNVIEGEAKNLYEASKESIEDQMKGTVFHAPSSKQLQAAATIASIVPAGEAATLGEKALTKAATEASNVGTAAKVGSKIAKRIKSAPRRKAEAVRTAPKRVARRVKETPKRVREAPARAKRATTTKEGRKAAVKGTGRKAAEHPLASFAGAGAVSNQAGADIPGLHQAGAFLEGHFNALKNDPGKTLETTARAIPGIVAAPAALLGSAGSSIIHGTPKPFTSEVSKQFEGTVGLGEKLLSGDPKEVQKTVENEVGLSVVAPLPALSRISKTKPYERVRGGARDKVAVKRERTRAKRRQELSDFKTGQRTKRPRKIRHAVKDTATGEERVLRRTGKVLEGHRQRKAVSRSLSRQKAQGEREALLSSKEVIKHIRRSKLSKGDHNIGDVLATVAQYGVSRDKAKALRQFNEIEASIGSIHPDELPAGTITDLANIRWLKEHPQAFTDKHFWRAVDAYKRQAKEIEFSGRKKVLAVGDVYGLARPEERLEAGVKVGGKTVRHNFYKDQATLQRKQAQLSDLRKDAKIAEQGAAKAKPGDRARYERVAAEIQGQAKSLERELKDYRSGFKQAQKDYVREAQATIREKGLEQPAYVKDVKPRQGLEPVPNFPGGRSARKQHMARAEQSRRGVTMARDFETLVNQSIAEPRMREAMHRATTDFADTWAVEFNGQRYFTSEEINRMINRGELDPSQHSVIHSQNFKQAILDPHKGSDELVSEVAGPLKGETRERANDPGNKYFVAPNEAAREFVHQMEPPKGMDKLFGGANRFLSRAILGYSPSWAAAQLVAEGIPASLALGMNPARWARVAKYLAKEDKRLNKKDRAAIDGTVGESAGVTPHPQVQFRPDTNMMGSRFFRLSSRNRIGRGLLKGATGEVLGSFDRWKGGKYRKVVAAAKADRELNGFVKSLSGLMRGQRSIVEAIKGKPIKEQMEYIARHPKEAAKLETYLDDVMGNWRALTRHEAKFAPLIVFYPFVRYSLRWMFWSFPKQHPVKAEILYFLAQQNANELEKLIGGKPQNWIDYATPVYTGSKGTDAVLPGGSRIAPGTNALVTAIGKGQVEGLASGLNPAAGLVISGITGVDPYTGEKVAETPMEHGLLALNQLLSMPAPLRMLKLNKQGGGEQSASSKVYEATDPNRGLRSFAFPFLPQSGEKFAEGEKFSRAQTQKYSDPIASIFDNPEVGEALFGPNGKVDWAKVKRLVSEHKLSEKASDIVKAAESPFFEDSGNFTDEQTKALQLLQGGLLIKPPEKKPNPFGLPDTNSDALREQFGLPATSSSELRKQFGIE